MSYIIFLFALWSGFTYNKSFAFPCFKCENGALCWLLPELFQIITNQLVRQTVLAVYIKTQSYAILKKVFYMWENFLCQNYWDAVAIYVRETVGHKVRFSLLKPTLVYHSSLKLQFLDPGQWFHEFLVVFAVLYPSIEVRNFHQI